MTWTVARSLIGLTVRPSLPAGLAALHQEGRDLLQLKDSQLRKIRGRDIAMIFQDPMTSLNPVHTVGHQIREALETHFDLDKHELDRRVLELLDQVGIPSANSATGMTSTNIRTNIHDMS